MAFFFVIWLTILSFLAVFMTVIGIAWSPFAALVGVLIARSRYYSTARLSSLSAFYSISSLFVWLSFSVNIVSERDHRLRRLISLAYSFSAWFIVMVAVVPLSAISEDSSASDGVGFFTNDPYTTLLGFVGLATSVVTWLICLARLPDWTQNNDWDDKFAMVHLPPAVFSTVWILYIVPRLYFGDNVWLGLSVVPLIVVSLLWIFWPSGPWLPQRIRGFFEDELL